MIRNPLDPNRADNRNERITKELMREQLKPHDFFEVWKSGIATLTFAGTGKYIGACTADGGLCSGNCLATYDAAINTCLDNWITCFDGCGGDPGCEAACDAAFDACIAAAEAALIACEAGCPADVCDMTLANPCDTYHYTVKIPHNYPYTSLEKLPFFKIEKFVDGHLYDISYRTPQFFANLMWDDKPAIPSRVPYMDKTYLYFNDLLIHTGAVQAIDGMVVQYRVTFFYAPTPFSYSNAVPINLFEGGGGVFCIGDDLGVFELELE